MSRRLRFFESLGSARAKRGVSLMGICNVTPDSFSDGGRTFDRESAILHARALVADGADIIDIGGESTRPGARPVPPREQIARTLEVVRALAGDGVCVSIDTMSAEVAAACLDAGACAVNDVSCLREPEIAKVCAAHDAALVLMHSRGSQADMKGFGAVPEDAYADVVAEVIAEWNAAADRALACGLSREALVMDPGLGFAKAAKHSLALLAHTRTIAGAVSVPVCVGASRKSFLATSVDPGAKPTDRIGASIAAALFAAREGAAILRVHDVRATRQALDLDREVHRA